MTVAVTSSSIYLGNNRIGNSHSAQHPVIEYFERHQDTIHELINEQLIRTKRKDHETLDFNNVRSEVYLRVVSIPPKLLTDEAIFTTLLKVLKDAGKDAESKAFERRMTSTSQLGKNNDSADAASLEEFILGDPTNRSFNEQVEIPPDKLLQYRQMFATLETLTRSEQKELVHLLQQGLSIDEIAEATQRKRANLLSSLRRIERKTRQKFQATPHPMISPDSWLGLTPSVRRAASLYFSGQEPEECRQSLGSDISAGTMWGYLYEARQALGLSAEEARSIKREKQIQEHLNNPSLVQRALIDFVNPDKAQETDDAKLFTTICLAFSTLTPTQRHDVKKFIQGFKKSEIAKKRNVQFMQVHESLLRAKESLEHSVKEIKSCPDGINPSKWVKLKDFQRNIMRLFIGIKS